MGPNPEAQRQAKFSVQCRSQQAWAVWCSILSRSGLIPDQSDLSMPLHNPTHLSKFSCHTQSLRSLLIHTPLFLSHYWSISYAVYPTFLEWTPKHPSSPSYSYSIFSCVHNITSCSQFQPLFFNSSFYQFSLLQPLI